MIDTFQVIPLEQAARLPDNSSIIPGDRERRYAVELSVLHDLHCLVSTLLDQLLTISNFRKRSRTTMIDFYNLDGMGRT